MRYLLAHLLLFAVTSAWAWRSARRHKPVNAAEGVPDRMALTMIAIFCVFVLYVWWEIRKDRKR